MALAETTAMSQIHFMFLNHNRLVQACSHAITEEQEKIQKHSKTFFKFLQATYLLTFHWSKQVAWPKFESKGQENRLK